MCDIIIQSALVVVTITAVIVSVWSVNKQIKKTAQREWLNKFIGLTSNYLSLVERVDGQNIKTWQGYDDDGYFQLLSQREKELCLWMNHKDVDQEELYNTILSIKVDAKKRNELLKTAHTMLKKYIDAKREQLYYS
ncbi:MAG: hypothetical protein LBK47_04235 [Prevotellaceae bacterium]|jgi:hypothetical protein|nr:hypothetical protein [Prevotellaceae bacterium]